MPKYQASVQTGSRGGSDEPSLDCGRDPSRVHFRPAPWTRKPRVPAARRHMLQVKRKLWSGLTYPRRMLTANPMLSMEQDGVGEALLALPPTFASV